MTRRGYYAICPNCQGMHATQRDYVRHLLQEAGDKGVTTNEFLRWHAGSRFGARVHELRHEEGLYITEDNELYALVGVMAAPEAEAPSVAGGGLRAAGGGGHETNALPLAWRCYRCADHDAGGPICPRGHQAEAVWLIDLRPRAAAPQVPVHDEMAEAA